MQLEVSKRAQRQWLRIIVYYNEMGGQRAAANLHQKYLKKCTAEPTLLCTFYRMLRMTPKLTPVKRLIWRMLAPKSFNCLMMRLRCARYHQENAPIFLSPATLPLCHSKEIKFFFGTDGHGWTLFFALKIPCIPCPSVPKNKVGKILL